MEENPPTLPRWNNFSGQTSAIKIITKQSLAVVARGTYIMSEADDVEWLVSSLSERPLGVTLVENVFFKK